MIGFLRKKRVLTPLLLFVCTQASASGIIVISNPKVPQQRVALAGLAEVLKDSRMLPYDFPALSKDLQSADVIIAVGQEALTVAAAQSTIPVVHCLVLGTQFAPNITGVALTVAPLQQLRDFTRVYRDAKRIGIIYSPENSSAFVAEATAAAEKLDVVLHLRRVDGPRGYLEALSSLLPDVDALWLASDPRLLNAELLKYVLLRTIEDRVAIFGFLDGMTRAGALASVAPDYRQAGRLAARMAQDILSKPSVNRLPVPPLVSSPGRLTINLKTAQRLGVEIDHDAEERAGELFR